MYLILLFYIFSSFSSPFSFFSSPCFFVCFVFFALFSSWCSVLVLFSLLHFSKFCLYLDNIFGIICSPGHSLVLSFLWTVLVLCMCECVCMFHCFIYYLSDFVFTICLCLSFVSYVLFVCSCVFVLIPFVHACICAKSLHSSLTLSDPMDYNLPGSSIHGIFQAKVLEWVAIAFSL